MKTYQENNKKTTWQEEKKIQEVITNKTEGYIKLYLAPREIKGIEE